MNTIFFIITLTGFIILIALVANIYDDVQGVKGTIDYLTRKEDEREQLKQEREDAVRRRVAKQRAAEEERHARREKEEREAQEEVERQEALQRYLSERRCAHCNKVLKDDDGSTSLAVELPIGDEAGLDLELKICQDCMDLARA